MFITILLLERFILCEGLSESTIKFSLKNFSNPKSKLFFIAFVLLASLYDFTSKKDLIASLSFPLKNSLNDFFKLSLSIFIFNLLFSSKSSEKISFLFFIFSISFFVLAYLLALIKPSLKTIEPSSVKETFLKSKAIICLS